MNIGALAVMADRGLFAIVTGENVGGEEERVASLLVVSVGC